MKVLIVSPPSSLAGGLVDALGKNHEIILSHARSVDAGTEETAPHLDVIEVARDLVRDVDVVVNNPSFDPIVTVSDQLDASALHMYNLLWAAADEGVQRVVHLSSLRVMEGFDPGYAVVEAWGPAPDAEGVSLLYHLSELVCREFAREALLDIVVLRLGEMAAGSGSMSTLALSVDDAVQAVVRAVTADFGAGHGPEAFRQSGHLAQRRLWNVFHIQSDGDGGRYSTAVAQEMLGFEPTKLGRGER